MVTISIIEGIANTQFLLAIPWRFFALAYGISWLMWALVLLHAFGGTKAPAVQVLPYAGVFGPCIAAMTCTGVEGRAAVGRLLRGILQILIRGTSEEKDDVNLDARLYRVSYQ